jgi:SPP1 family holin
MKVIMNNPRSVTGFIVAVLALVNLVLQACGIDLIPIDEKNIEAGATAAIGLIGSMIATWNNFSATDAATVADSIGRKIKSGELTIKQVLDAIDAITASAKETEAR